MTNFIFTRNNRIFKRVSKSYARNLFNAGCTISMCACKVQPTSPWGLMSDVRKSDDCTDFDTYVNAFEFYNCNNELGNYAAFYAEVE